MSYKHETKLQNTKFNYRNLNFILVIYPDLFATNRKYSWKKFFIIHHYNRANYIFNCCQFGDKYCCNKHKNDKIIYFLLIKNSSATNFSSSLKLILNDCYVHKIAQVR